VVPLGARGPRGYWHPNVHLLWHAEGDRDAYEHWPSKSKSFGGVRPSMQTGIV
jgi:hypothetical protein